jgi:hypothetical protein
MKIINALTIFLLLVAGMCPPLLPSNALEKQYELKEIPAGSELASRDRALAIEKRVIDEGFDEIITDDYVSAVDLKESALRQNRELPHVTKDMQYTPLKEKRELVKIVQDYVGDTFNSESERVCRDWRKNNIWDEDKITRRIVAVRGSSIFYSVGFEKEQGSVICEYIPSLMLSRVLPENPLYSGLQSETHDFNTWKTCSYSNVSKEEILRSAALWKSLGSSRGQAEEELAKFPEKVRVVSIYPGPHGEEDHVVLPFSLHPFTLRTKMTKSYDVIDGDSQYAPKSTSTYQTRLIKNDIKSVYSRSHYLFIKCEEDGVGFSPARRFLICLDSRTSMMFKDQDSDRKVAKCFEDNSDEELYRENVVVFKGGMKDLQDSDQRRKQYILIRRSNEAAQLIPRKNYESYFHESNSETFCRFGPNLYLLVQTAMSSERSVLLTNSRSIIEIHKAIYQEQEDGKEVLSTFEKIGEKQIDFKKEFLFGNQKLFTSPSGGIVAFYDVKKICFFDFRTALHEKERQARLEESWKSTHNKLFSQAVKQHFPQYDRNSQGRIGSRLKNKDFSARVGESNILVDSYKPRLSSMSLVAKPGSYSLVKNFLGMGKIWNCG